MVLKRLEKKIFAKSLVSPTWFAFARKVAYFRARGDPEKVHEMALEALVEYKDVVEEVAAKHFNFQDLCVNLNGHNVAPFGTAAGLDKNGVALEPLSHIFGYLEWGTVVVPRRDGNNPIRVAVDNKNEDLYNAQGFPSKGINECEKNVKKYHGQSGKAPLLTSICGLPESVNKLSVAHEELETLVTRLNPYSAGFVWNPFSPNTDALKALRTPEVFRKSAEIISKTSGNKLKLVKMGPYDDTPEAKNFWLKLIRAFLDGGGNGIVAVNTFMVPKEDVIKATSVKKWGYQSAGRSGRFLQPYRERAVLDARQEFPDAFIIATGGINSASEAWRALRAGANALEFYTPLTFYGPGLLIEIANGIRERIHRYGYETLQDYLASVKPRVYKN